MSEEGERSSDDGKHGAKVRAEVARNVADVSERALPVASTGVAIATVLRMAVGEVPVFGPIAIVAATSLLPIAIAAVERRREARSARAERARAWADDAWGAVVANRQG